MIAIIGVLAALLVPALKRARATASCILCLSNHRQLNLAIHNYAVDDDGYLVPAAIGSGYGKPASYPSWFGVSPQHTMLLGQYTGVDDSQAPWGTISDGSVWRCPEDGISGGTLDVSYSLIGNTSGSGRGQFFVAVTSNYWGTNRWTQQPKMSQVKHASMLMTFADKVRYNGKITFAIGGGWPTKDNMSVPLYGSPANEPNVPYTWDKNQPRKNWNHRMWHPPFRGGTPVGTNMGFIDGHAETIENTPSNVDDEYWLRDSYGIDFIFRPQDYRD